MKMPMSSRIKAFLAYLFLALGAILVLLISRKDRFAVFHARQSLILTGAALLTLVVWVVIAYPLSWIPLLGPPLASGTFGLVIAAFAALIVAWVLGMVYALRAKEKRVPLIGNTVKRWR
jgi:uncharacterized membrane protein